MVDGGLEVYRLQFVECYYGQRSNCGGVRIGIRENA
jgi:hypothetical protein